MLIVVLGATNLFMKLVYIGTQPLPSWWTRSSAWYALTSMEKFSVQRQIAVHVWLHGPRNFPLAQLHGPRNYPLVFDHPNAARVQTGAKVQVKQNNSRVMPP
jgi:hypothetical protein